MKVLAFIIFALAIAADVFGAKLPDYIDACKTTTPDYDKCLLKLIENLKPRLVKGISKLKIPKLDPFELNELTFDRKLDGGTVKAILNNIKVVGASQFVVTSLKADIDNLGFNVTISLPSIHVNSDYDVRGTVLSVTLSGKGSFEGDFTDVKAIVGFTGKEVEKDGEKYLDVDKVTSNIRIGGGKIKLNDADGTNSAATQAAAEFFNQNPRGILDSIKPIIDDSSQEIIAAIASKILATVPIEELLPK